MTIDAFLDCPQCHGLMSVPSGIGFTKQCPTCVEIALSLLNRDARPTAAPDWSASREPVPVAPVAGTGSTIYDNRSKTKRSKSHV